MRTDWLHRPSGFKQGELFRLLFVTFGSWCSSDDEPGKVDRRPSAGSTDIADYNDFVQCHAEREYNDPVVRDHAQRFRALVSTASVDARDNTATTGIGVPIHWNGGNSDRPDISHGEAGPKVADDYADFYDGDWDEECRWHYPFGNGRALRETQRIDTGSQADGTGHAGHELGAATVAAGTLRAPTEGSARPTTGRWARWAAGPCWRPRRTGATTGSRRSSRWRNDGPSGRLLAPSGGMGVGMLVAVPPAVHSPLTAKFEGLPDSHDGSTPFAFRIVFSEAIDATAAELRDEALAVTGASVTAAARAAGPEETWQITLAPAGGGDIAILLEAGRACSEAGAICTPDGRKLEVGVGVLLPGPRGTTIVPSGETGQQGQKLGGGAVTAVEVAVAAGASPVSEGTAAGFSLTRAGSADAALTVAVQVSETGAMLASGAPSAVTFAAGESGAALQLATDDDRAVEPASAVTVAIAAGSGYAAAASGAAATVRVEDNDEAQFEVTAEPAEIAEGSVRHGDRAHRQRGQLRGPARRSRWPSPARRPRATTTPCRPTACRWRRAPARRPSP